MSRSIHKTVKGVLGGKTNSELIDLMENPDSDLEELVKKKKYKQAERNRKASTKEPNRPQRDEE